MWKRFTRLLKSLFGGAISSMEDPRLILEQNIRELNDQIPEMNKNIATVKSSVVLLEKEAKKYKVELQRLTSRVKAAIQAGRDDIAQQYALRLEQTREASTRTKEQLQYARQAYEKSLQVKKVFMQERQRKINDAKEALRAHERAKWQARVADTLEQFEVTGIDQTHDEMLNRINEETAKNEARMELALDSIDTDAMQIEADAEAIRAQELVNQFKLEMGMFEEPEPEVELPAESETVQGQKTVGRQRTQS